jgi:hypothetical protein
MAPEAPYTIGGYLSEVVTISLPKAGDPRTDLLTHHRIDLRYRAGTLLELTAGLRNRLITGDSVPTPGFSRLTTDDGGFWDLSWNWADGKRTLGNSTLDRLYLNGHLAGWALRAGRHRINWGMTTLWNPNDLFNVYTIFDFDYPERPGTDGLLLSRAHGIANLWELAWGFGHSNDSRLAGRYLFNKWGYDIQLLAGHQQDEWVTGMGFSGSIVDTALRGEVSHFNRLETTGGLPPTTVATLEAMHHFSARLSPSLQADVLYHSRPQSGAVAIRLNQRLDARSMAFSRWSGYLNLDMELTPLNRLTCAIGSYDDGSRYFSVGDTLSLANNLDMLLLWQRFGGHSGSLFGDTRSNLLFARIRWNY